MIELLRRPESLAVLVGAVLTLLLSFTRFVSWSFVAAVVVLVGAAEIGCFDGQPHLTKKFDATTFVWLEHVGLRSIGGCAIVAAGTSIGAALRRELGIRHGRVIGAAIVAPFACALFASSIIVEHSLRALFASSASDEARLVLLQTTVHRSSYVILLGTGVSMLLTLLLVLRGGTREATCAVSADRAA